jgi:hypothetical protein
VVPVGRYQAAEFKEMVSARPSTAGNAISAAPAMAPTRLILFIVLSLLSHVTWPTAAALIEPETVREAALPGRAHRHAGVP